jgi:hypothetical protein
MGSALSEAKELDHEDAVGTLGLVLSEEGVEVGTETVFCLFVHYELATFIQCYMLK